MKEKIRLAIEDAIKKLPFGCIPIGDAVVTLAVAEDGQLQVTARQNYVRLQDVLPSSALVCRKMPAKAGL